MTRLLQSGCAALMLLVWGHQPAVAQFACPTAQDVSIQRALDAAAAAGGGTVNLPAGVYETCETLVLGSNVHLRGAGRGATVIRGSAAIRGKLVGGAYLGTTLGGAGVTNVSVSDLTVDHRTHARNANGISFVPTGSGYTGTVPTNVLVERVEVLGAGAGYHNYLIWNFKGQHVKIRDNWLDGGYEIPIAAPWPQEGIESFGGYDVLITGNTVRAVAGACINVGSAGIPDSTTVGITVAKNFLDGCHMGINLGTSSENGGQHNFESKITDNFILRSAQFGVHVPIADGTIQRNLEISGNMIRAVGPGPYAIGIRLGAGTNADVRGVTIARNTIDTVSGIHGQGIRVDVAAHVRVLDNTLYNTSGYAVVGYFADDLEISRNRIEGAGGYGINVGPAAARPIITGNVIADWPAVSPAILLEGLTYGGVHRNLFLRADVARPATIIVIGSCGVEMTGNQALYPGPAANGAGLPCQ